MLPILALLLASYISLRMLKFRRRQQAFRRVFPTEWEEKLTMHMPMYEMLPESLQCKLKSHINVFLNEKRFFGCNDLQITDELFEDNPCAIAASIGF